jgi:metal-responsive CopG/Arc/MetJ family transcriptional regulator
MSRKLVQVRLPADLVKQIDHMAVEWGIKRGPAMERLLREALERAEGPQCDGRDVTDCG